MITKEQVQKAQEQYQTTIRTFLFEGDEGDKYL